VTEKTNDYRSRMDAIRTEQARLKTAQAQLIEKRKTELGRLFERMDLLGVDDDVLIGALLELKSALSKTEDARLARWQQAGVTFRGKSDRKAAAAQSPHDVEDPIANGPAK